MSKWAIEKVMIVLHYNGIKAIKLNMFNNNIDIESLLKQLGQRLKEARLARNERQELFAQRLGLTRQSYSRMEKGSAQILIGNWLPGYLIGMSQELESRTSQMMSTRLASFGPMH
jgi:DNA-binding XRE family transcriptional regulator